MDNNSIADLVRATRQQFFAYRNGILADRLRTGGDPHTSIMGCQLTDVLTIARQLPASAELARAFWADPKSRECRMIAPALFPPALMGLDEAREWIGGVESLEIADILCHRLLRHISHAQELLNLLPSTERPLSRYALFRLMLNLLLNGAVKPCDRYRQWVAQEQKAAPQALRELLASITEELDAPA